MSWRPGPAAASTVKFPVVARRYYPLLVEKASRNQRLTAFERLTLDCYKVGDGTRVKYAGVLFFVRQLGLDYTPLNEIQSIFPCIKTIDDNTGFNVDATTKSSSECGVKMFCTGCFGAMRVLGGAWHLHSGAEVVTRVLNESLSFWVNGQSAVEWWPWSQEAHVCGPNCPAAY